MNVMTPADVIEALRQRRQELGLSQEAVSLAAGLSVGRVGLWERRAETPRMDLLLAWMGVLGLAFEIAPAPPERRRSALLGSTALTPPGRIAVARAAGS